ncbi:peptidylprolyl isomerase [bacterium]|nr:peptidylprolyl isomerase [bacterium]
MYRIRVILVTLTFFLAYKTLTAQDVLDRIIAVVGDKIILQSQLYQYSYSLAMQLGIDPQKDTAKLEELRRETLKNLVVQKLLLVQAELDSVTVNDQQVDALLEQQINQIVQQAGTEQKVEEFFGMNIRQIRRDFRKDVEERLLVDTITNRKKQETRISRREVEEFYEANRDSLPDLKESVNISHILVKVEANEAAEKAAMDKAKEVLDRLKKGEDFEVLARQYSEGPTASRGGDLGMVKRGDLVKEFEEVAFQLEPGEISDLVKTQFGFHIIQLVQRAGERVNPRHILFRLETTEDDEKATILKLNELKDRILSGDITFEDAAKEYSTDATTASRGGDLGWFQIHQFEIEAFKTAVEGLQAGEFTDPTKTQFGHHLIRVNDRKSARKIDLNEDWEQIEVWALNLKQQREFEKWVDELRKEIYIDVKI